MPARERLRQRRLRQGDGKERALRRLHWADIAHQFPAHTHRAHSDGQYRNLYTLGKHRRSHRRTPLERLRQQLRPVAEIFAALPAVGAGGSQPAQVRHQRILPARDGLDVHFRSPLSRFFYICVSHYIINRMGLSSKSAQRHFVKHPPPSLHSAAPCGKLSLSEIHSDKEEFFYGIRKIALSALCDIPYDF